jgi:hypothetical protein
MSFADSSDSLKRLGAARCSFVEPSRRGRFNGLFAFAPDCGIKVLYGTRPLWALAQYTGSRFSRLFLRPAGPLTTNQVFHSVHTRDQGIILKLVDTNKLLVIL